jgi:predicted nucleic acid-binding protein
MSGKIFVDTNVLIYAHDRKAGRKGARALEVIRELWNQQNGVLSTQVLQELYIGLRCKVSDPLSAQEAEQVLFDYFAWEIFTNNRESVIRAAQLETRYKISFWDALILQAAEGSGCTLVCSEGLNSGQLYGAVRVLNPFL